MLDMLIQSTGTGKKSPGILHDSEYLHHIALSKIHNWWYMVLERYQ